MQEFNYNRLFGKIKEAGLTQEELAEKIGTTPSTLSLKLNNKGNFKQKEIYEICNILFISPSNIGDIFFNPKV